MLQFVFINWNTQMFQDFHSSKKLKTKEKLLQLSFTALPLSLCTFPLSLAAFPSIGYKLWMEYNLLAVLSTWPHQLLHFHTSIKLQAKPPSRDKMVKIWGQHLILVPHATWMLWFITQHECTSVGTSSDVIYDAHGTQHPFHSLQAKTPLHFLHYQLMYWSQLYM
jgi:hypothetical protein